MQLTIPDGAAASLTDLDGLWLKLRRVELIRGEAVEQRLVQSYTLIMTKSGAGCVTINMRQYRLRKEAVYFALPGETVGIASEAKGELEVYAITFDAAGDVLQPGLFPANGEMRIQLQSHITALCEQMYSCSLHEHPLERFRSQSVFLELLYVLLSSKLTERHTDSRELLEQTKAYIDRHYNESLTIEQLAGMARLSPKYYVDLFKKTYGKSAIDYLTEVRVNRAKVLMAASGVRLRDIAHQVGYNDEFYFSRKFKQEVGVPPTVYMESRSRKIAAYSSHSLGLLLPLKLIPYAAALHPKWTAYYYRKYRSDIAVHLSAYRTNEDWEANIAALVRAEPDMIVCREDSLRPGEREKLENIAPVLVLPWNGSCWREQLQSIARHTGTMQEAEQWLAAYSLKAAQARKRLRREIGDDTVLVVSIFKQQCRICPTRGMQEIVYEELRLAAPRGFDSGAFEAVVPASRLADFDADRIMINVCQEEESLQYWRQLQVSPLWRDLKAVRTNKVYPISSDPWREYSAYACERMIDDLLHLMCAGKGNG